MWEHRHPTGCWLAVCAGMGGARAAEAFRAARERVPLDAVCSVGWAGSLSAAIPAGAVRRVSVVIDTQTGERFRAAQPDEGRSILASTAGVADVTEKQRLAASYGAGLVDMEAATIARLALGSAIPFYCIKGVSDGADARLPDFNPFLNAAGQLRMAPFLMHVAVRPAGWRGLMRLGRNSAEAARSLAREIYVWLGEENGVEMTEAGYAGREVR